MHKNILIVYIIYSINKYNSLFRNLYIFINEKSFKNMRENRKKKLEEDSAFRLKKLTELLMQ